MIYTKKLKLNAGYLHNLRKDEFATLVGDVVNIAKTFNIDDKMTSMLLDRLKEDEIVLRTVVHAPLEHKNSKLIDEYHDNMRRLMIGLKNSIKSFHYLRDDEMKQATSTLNNWIGVVRHEMGSQTKIRALHAASVLTRQYQQSEEIKKAAETLGVSVYYNEIEWLFNEITEMSSERLHSNTELQSLRKGLRERVTFNLDLFFSTLLAMVSIEDEKSPMYYSLSTRLEQVMTGALAIQRTRTTKNKNKKNRELDDNLEAQNNKEMPDRQGAANGIAEINTKKTEAGIDRMEAHSNNVKAIGGSTEVYNDTNNASNDRMTQTPAKMPDRADIKLLPPGADNI